MAGIGRFKPLSPLWPVPAVRKVEEDDESPARQQHQPADKEGEEEKKDDNAPPHIDEYA